MKEMIQKQLGSLVRSSMTWLGGLISAHGIADASAASSMESGLTQILTGLIMWGISAAWSWYRNRKLVPVDSAAAAALPTAKLK